MRYVVARYNEHVRDTTYRICITDCLRINTENTALLVSGGKIFKARYYDLVHPQPKETRTAEDVINHVKSRLERL